MPVFVISDLHLSSDTTKSMEVFGPRWRNYMSRLEQNWNKVVGENDTVIIPGDISWALTLEGALPDLFFLDRLHGKKIIGKGNHDYWWSTQKKIKEFFESNRISTIDILYNNAHVAGEIVICGTRGWYNEQSRPQNENQPDYAKIINREAIRLRLSITAAEPLAKETGYPLVAFFHFPPVWNEFVCRELVDILHEHNIKKCYYGHIHGYYGPESKFVFEDVTFQLVSSDFLDFMPVPVRI
ncbi:MAG: serine/threonine protein phosphatase [Clostridiales bacterium]|nr:serine/threonine protein phosphatase [Clostridiales bacterium]